MGGSSSSGWAGSSGTFSLPSWVLSWWLTIICIWFGSWGWSNYLKKREFLVISFPSLLDSPSYLCAVDGRARLSMFELCTSPFARGHNEVILRCLKGLHKLLKVLPVKRLAIIWNSKFWKDFVEARRDYSDWHGLNSFNRWIPEVVIGDDK